MSEEKKCTVYTQHTAPCDFTLPSNCLHPNYRTRLNRATQPVKAQLHKNCHYRNRFQLSTGLNFCTLPLFAIEPVFVSPCLSFKADEGGPAYMYARGWGIHGACTGLHCHTPCWCIPYRFSLACQFCWQQHLSDIYTDCTHTQTQLSLWQPLHVTLPTPHCSRSPWRNTFALGCYKNLIS